MRFYTDVEYVKGLMSKLPTDVVDRINGHLAERWSKLQVQEIYTDSLLGYLTPIEIEVIEYFLTLD